MTTSRPCAVCGQPFRPPSRRGRPPTKCDACLTTTLTGLRELTAREHRAELDDSIRTYRVEDRIDYLELMLRARGTHISQHRGDYD